MDKNYRIKLICNLALKTWEGHEVDTLCPIGFLNKLPESSIQLLASLNTNTDSSPQCILFPQLRKLRLVLRKIMIKKVILFPWIAILINSLLKRGLVNEVQPEGKIGNQILGQQWGFLGFNKLTIGVVFSVVVIWRWTLAMRHGCGTHRIERRTLNVLYKL